MSLLPDRLLFAASALLGLILLSGCGATDANDVSAANAGGDLCGAAGYQNLLGQPLAAVTLPASLKSRVIHPGDLVTQDYVEDRLNIELDAQGRIIRLSCG